MLIATVAVTVATTITAVRRLPLPPPLLPLPPPLPFPHHYAVAAAVTVATTITAVAAAVTLPPHYCRCRRRYRCRHHCCRCRRRYRSPTITAVTVAAAIATAVALVERGLRSDNNKGHFVVRANFQRAVNVNTVANVRLFQRIVAANIDLVFVDSDGVAFNSTDTAVDSNIDRGIGITYLIGSLEYGR